MTAEEIIARLSGVKKSQTGWYARCPVPEHDDHRQSLHIADGRDGRVVLKCYRGCKSAQIMEAIGLTVQDLFPAKGNGNGDDSHDHAPHALSASRKSSGDRSGDRGPIVATYHYLDEEGRELFRKLRYANKDFVQCRVEGGKTIWRLGDTRRVLYRLTRVLAAAADHATVYVVEGEKDVEAVEKAGAVATCNPEGASQNPDSPKWKEQYTQMLKGVGSVIVVADRDETGRTHARHIVESLKRAGIPGKLVEAAAGKDAYDHLEAGLTLDDFTTIEEFGPVRLVAYTVNQLLDRQPELTSWICYPYVAEGDVLSFESPPKDGKTTFVLAMVNQIAASGAFLGEKVAGGPVLYCTEERVGTFLDALKRTGNYETSENLHVLLLHDAAWRLPWADTTAEIQRLADEIGARFVVVDTLSKWAGLSGDDEQSSGIAMSTMTPLQHLASSGHRAVAVIRHERKNGGEVGQAGRGSGGWAGEMDTIIAVRRIAGEPVKSKRLVATKGRHDDTPEERIVDFNGDEFKVLGSPEDVRRLENERQILDGLGWGPDGGRSLNDLRGDMPRQTAERILERFIREGVVGHVLGDSQGGRRPRLYWLRTDA